MADKQECGNCRFYKDESTAKYKDGYGACRRFPEHFRTNDGRWCGEWAEFVAGRKGVGS